MITLVLAAALTVQVPFPCPGHWVPAANPDESTPGRYLTVDDAHAKVVDGNGHFVGITGDHGGTFKCEPGEGETL